MSAASPPITPGGAGGLGKLSHHPHHALRGRLRALPLPRESRKGRNDQRVSGQERRGLAKSHVARGLSPAQVGVVNRGEVVVDERGGMQQLEGARGGHDRLGREAIRRGGLADHQRAHALPPARECASAGPRAPAWGEAVGRNPGSAASTSAEVACRRA